MSGNTIEYVSPPAANLFNAVTINCLSNECLGLDFYNGTQHSGLASAGWTANLLIFVPLMVPRPTVVSQFHWQNGATVNGNTDVGIYTFDGATKLGSTGSTANSGTSQIQVVDISNFNIPANQRLWLALGSDSGSQTYWRSSIVVGYMDLLGIKQQSSGWSSGLPSSVTFGTPTLASVPLFGFTGGTI